ncbi:hypothetical protein [Halocynthiibacter sp.]|uniref:hypothetical protein n=1 Tax=Halocynthiibacter sp. TaxID=1979210 RepID=UPI003C55D8E2
MKKLLALVFALSAGPALACGPSAPLAADVLLSCKIEGRNRVLSVCAANGQAYYSYGTPDQSPELELIIPLRDVEVTPWPGVGGAIWEEMIFTNNDVEYVVWQSLRRDPENPEHSGGVNIREKGTEAEVLLSLTCDPAILFSEAGVFAFSDAKLANGQKWDLDQHIWVDAQ